MGNAIEETNKDTHMVKQIPFTPYNLPKNNARGINIIPEAIAQYS